MGLSHIDSCHSSTANLDGRPAQLWKADSEIADERYEYFRQPFHGEKISFLFVTQSRPGPVTIFMNGTHQRRITLWNETLSHSSLWEPSSSPTSRRAKDAETLSLERTMNFLRLMIFGRHYYYTLGLSLSFSLTGYTISPLLPVALLSYMYLYTYFLIYPLYQPQNHLTTSNTLPHPSLIPSLPSPLP